MKKFKAIVSIVLVIAMAVILCACGASNTPADNTTPSNSTPSGNTTPSDNDKKDDAKKDEEPAQQEYTEKYNFIFSCIDASGGTWDQLIAQPLVKMLDEYSDGRISTEVYYSGAIAGQGTTLEAVSNGLADMGVDVMTAYKGIYPYCELYETAGIDYGSTESFTRLYAEYVDLFHDDFDDFVTIARYSSGLIGLLSKFPINSVADVKGHTFRCPTNINGYITAMGGTGTMMSMNEVYEALKLNVIEGCSCTLSRVGYNAFWEQAKYFLPWTWSNGAQTIAMTKANYDSMDPGAQAAIDKVCDEFMEVGINYVKTADAEALDVVMKACPDFTYTQLTPEATEEFVAAANADLEAKADELNGLGLDGTGALEWCRANAKKYFEG